MALFGNRGGVDPHVSTFSNGAGNRSNNRTNWPGMYAGGKGGMMVGRSGAPRWMITVTVVLLIALVGLAIFGVPAITYRTRSEGTFVNRMLTECGDALTLANSLSRSGGAESAATLGRIRSDIHAIDTVNEVRNTLGGGYYVPPYVFTNLYSIIDSYSNNLKLGNVTMQNLTDLVKGLEELQGMLVELK